MGDSGSLFLGALIGMLTFPLHVSRAANLTVFGAAQVGILVIAVFFFDTCFVFLTRLRRGQSPAVGGRDHVAHRLVRIGFTESNAVRLMFLAAVVCASAAVFIVNLGKNVSGIVFGFIVIGFVIGGIFLDRSGFSASPNALRRRLFPGFMQSLITNRIPRAVLEILLSSFSLYLAFLLRFGFDLPPDSMKAMNEALPIVAMVTAVVVVLSRNVWSAADRSKPLIVGWFAVRAFAIAVMSIATVTMVSRFEAGLSRGAFLLFGVIYFSCSVGLRYGILGLERLLGVVNSSVPWGVVICAAENRCQAWREVLADSLADRSVLGFCCGRVCGGDVGGLPVKSVEEWTKVDNGCVEFWLVDAEGEWSNERKSIQAECETHGGKWKVASVHCE